MRKLLIRSIGFYLNALVRLAPEKAGKKGFDLFCRPIRMPLKPHQLEFLYTAELSKLPIEGNNIQVYKWGNGPKKLLFLHGWQSHSFRWKKYVDTFDKNEYSLYALDAPAHGLSEGKYITALVYSKTIVEFISQLGPFSGVISHSLGGFSLLYSLYKYPSLPVEKVVLMGVPGEVTDFFDFFQQTLGLGNNTMKHIYLHAEKIIGLHPSAFSSSVFVEGLSLPALFIHDEQDKDASYHYAKRAHEKWNGSQLITTSGLGHNLKSKEVVQWVVNYIQETDVLKKDIITKEEVKI